MSRLVRTFLYFGLIISQLACYSVPHLIWPQEDVVTREVKPNEVRSILIAARRSEFKEMIINAIKINYQDDSVHIKIIGLDNLGLENPDHYQVIVLINTCMSWDMDRNVNSFLKKYSNQDNIIILTTSGDGNWLPKKKNRQFDAVSSASIIADVDKISQEIITKIDHLLN